MATVLLVFHNKMYVICFRFFSITGSFRPNVELRVNVILPLFSNYFQLTFRYREPFHNAKSYNIFLSLGTIASADWVVQGATTQHKLVAPLIIFVVQDNQTTVNFEPWLKQEWTFDCLAPRTKIWAASCEKNAGVD